MPHIKISSKDAGHDHIVYIKDKLDENGLLGYTSADNGHQHQVIYEPEIPPQQDPQTGQEIPGTPEKITVMPSEGKNSHSHEIGDFLKINPEQYLRKKSRKEDKEQRLGEYLRVYEQTEEDDKFYLEHAPIAEGAYFGDGQWSDEDKALLDEQGRPIITINKIKPKISALIGYESQNSTIPKYLPNEEGDAVLADIITELNYHTLSKNKYPTVRNEVFEDETVTGRGNYCVRLDYSKNLNGDIIVERFPWQDVKYLHHDKKDASDCEGLCAERWISEGKLKLMLPEKLLKEAEKNELFSKDVYSSGDVNIDFSKNGLIDLENNKFKLIQVQKKEYRKRSVILNADDEYYLDGMEGRLSGWLLDKKTKDRLKSIPGFTIIDRMVEEIWIGLFAGAILISDRRSPFSRFTLIPAYASKRGKKVKGVVYDLVDPSRELNKRRSTISEMASKLSGGGYFYDDNTFDSEEDLVKFEEDRSTPGFNVKVSDTERPPRREDAIPIPRDLLLLEQQSTEDLTEISGINEELVGIGSNAESTPLYIERKNSALIGNEYLFSGLALADTALALILIEAYRIVYTPDRVYQILANNNKIKSLEGGIKLGNEPFEKYTQKDIEQLWTNVDMSHYDISIGFGDNTPTKQAADYKTWSKLREQGLELPAEFLLELSPMPPDQKNKLNEIMGAQQQAQAQQKQEELASEQNNIAIENQSKEKIALAEIQSKEKIEFAKLELKRQEIAFKKNNPTSSTK